jgi:type I restriction enzyme S subunit
MVTLGEVAKFVRGVTFKPSDVLDEATIESVGVMRTKNVQDEIDLNDVLQIPRDLVHRNDQYLHGGDILISSANSWNLVGRCCWVPELSAPAVIGGFVTGLRVVSGEVDRRYLYRWFSSPRAQAQVRNTANQTTNIANLNLRRCEGIELPLPPLREQRRIAAILDHADTLRAKRQSVVEKLKDLSRALFLEMFGAEAKCSVSPRTDRTHHKGWRWVSLNEVAELATGHTPDRNRADYWDGTIPWISLPDIRQLDGTTAESTSLNITEAGLANSSAVLLPPGTVCFSRTASIGFVTKTGSPMATSQDFHNWIPGPYIDSDYLMAALRTSRAHLLGSSDGSTHKTIYQRVAANFRILLPPLDLQHEFSRRLKAAEHVGNGIHKESRDLDELFCSLQSRAFRGEL